MPLYFVNQIGPYTLGAQIATVEEELSFREQSVTLAGRGGRYSADSVFDGLILTLTGLVLATDVAGGDPNNPGSLRAAWDLVKQAFITSGSLPLYIDNDRHCNVRLASSIKTTAWNGLPTREYSVALVSREDPPWFADAVSAVGPFGSGNSVLATAGTGRVEPQISLAVVNASVGGQITLQDTTGHVFYLTPDTANTTYIIDSYAETVTAGGVDKMHLFSGDFMRLLPGANTLTYTMANSVTGTWSAQWQDRFY